jgi:mannose/fructose/N-acetylgalactosamine-specific phosphotransferase system component IIC
LLLVDALINLMLGVLLTTFPKSVVDFLGVPDTDATFYPSILGAVLIGIGIALVIEYLRKPTGAAGLGLHGAIAINLCGAVFLIGWLLSGRLGTPLRGQAFLWGLAVVLIVISLVEFVVSREESRMCEENKGCQCPDELKGDPKECSPEQIKKCHGDAREHPCEPKEQDG